MGTFCNKQVPTSKNSLPFWLILLVSFCWNARLTLGPSIPKGSTSPWLQLSETPNSLKCCSNCSLVVSHKEWFTISSDYFIMLQQPVSDTAVILFFILRSSAFIELIGEWVLSKVFQQLLFEVWCNIILNTISTFGISLLVISGFFRVQKHQSKSVRVIICIDKRVIESNMFWMTAKFRPLWLIPQLLLQ